MFKKLLLAVVVPLLLSVSVHAERVKCQDSISPNDVIAVDVDSSGNPVEFHRNPEDIAKIIQALKQKIADDPSVTQSPQWNDRMLTSVYWERERCGGTKNCDTKECPNGRSCVHRDGSMGGCRCE
jgi:hypothetical protein